MSERNGESTSTQVKDAVSRIGDLTALLSERAICDRKVLAEVKKQANLVTCMLNGEIFAELFSELLLAIDRLTLEEINEDIARSVSEEMLDVCQRFGLTRIDGTGTFDPSVHDAVSVCIVDDQDQDGVIVQEERAGYMIGDRLLRPARVVVGKYSTID